MGHRLSKQKKGEQSKKKGRNSTSNEVVNSPVHAGRPVPAVPAARPATTQRCMFNVVNINRYKKLSYRREARATRYVSWNRGLLLYE